MKNFFSFTRRKGPSTTRVRSDVNRHSIGSHSSVSNRSLVIQLIRGAYNIDLTKVDQSFSKLHKACFLNYDINKIKKYLKQGANPNQLDNASRSSPLHLATVNGNSNVIRLLIEHGGNIDLPDGDGKTPVIKAIECFHKECLQYLILQGSDVNICDNQLGNTALHWSIINNFADGLKILLAYSPRLDINRKNKAGESPLHLLVRCPDLHRYVNDLLDKGAEIDIRNNQQRTPLMTACEHGHLEIARALINRGSYIYHQDEAGFSALAIAKRNGHTSLVQYLTDLGGLESPRRTLQVETQPKVVDDSWPSTEEEDELEEIAAAKTRKFDPIIQQLKSLQGSKQDDRLLQPSGTSQLKEIQVKSSTSGGQSLEETKSLVGRESSHESNLMGPFNTLESFTKVQREDSLFSSHDKSTEDEAIESNKKMKSSSLKSQESRGVVSAEPTLGHIDSVYSHEASNDEFIREIKNLLDEEIRENDELDALLFATSVDPVSNSKDNNKVNDTNETGIDVDHSRSHHNQSSANKVVHKSDSIESSALQKSSSDPAKSAFTVNLEPSTSISTVETEKLKSKAGQSKNVIHVDILSDLWEDWAKSDETEEELSPVKAFNGLSKDFSDSKETAQKILPNEKEILGKFFLNDISDESSEEIEPEDEMRVEKEEKMRKGEEKSKEDEQVKKEKSTEAGRRKSLIKDETTSFSNDHHHEPISSSLTPNVKGDSANNSIDMSTNLMSSQSKVISPPLPPPPPSLSPPPAFLLPPPPPSLLSTSSILSSSTTTLPPALPARPGTSFTKDLYKFREKSIERSSIEVQTELDEMMPQLKELHRLKEKSESKLKHLEMEMKKQSSESERSRDKLIKEMNFIEEEKKMLERRLDEVIDSRDRLIEEKKRLTESEERLRKQLKSFEECKCNQLKEELKEFKEKVKSRGNYNNDEFIRKLHDLNDECNDLRRELSAEQTALRNEINQLEKDKEVFKLENQWLKEKLEEMRDQMRRHLSSQDDGQKSNGRFEGKRRKTGKGEGKEEEEEDEEDKTLEEMRKVMVAIECLLTKLDDKISGLNLEEQKKLMEKIIIEIAKSQINQQVETMFKGIRSLLEDLLQELNSFQLTIEKQMNGANKNQSDDIEIGDSKDSSSQPFESKDDADALVDETFQTKSDSNGLPKNKTTTNGFAIFESRISQLTSSIEKLEDNIERQEMNMLIRARGHIWSSFEEDDGRCVHENSLLINMFNGTHRKMSNRKQIYPNQKPQSGFVQSLMKLQSTGKPSYSKLVNHLNANYEPSLLFDFHYAKTNLSKQIANLKNELGLTC